MTDPRDKARSVDRYLRHAKKFRSRDEQRELDEHIRRRQAERGGKRGKRRRSAAGTAGEDVGEEAFEKIRRAERWSGRRDPHAPSAAGSPAAVSGDAANATVIGIAAGRVRVVPDGGAPVDAVLVPALARVQRSAVAIGDRVECDADASSPRVVGVAPRRTWLGRADPTAPDRVRVVAANVDLAVLVLVAPNLRAGLVDRFAVAVRRGGVAPLVCVNKSDLVEDVRSIEPALAPHRAAGIDVLFVSAVTGDGIDALRRRLAGRACVLVGHSGVGKSSLVNALSDGALQRVGEVRVRDGKGRHTTVDSTLHALPDGIRIIDTPGVRAFGLGPVSAAELDAAFPDIAAVAAGCRFADCGHGGEPDCAVRAAVQCGELAPARVESYRRIASG